MATSAQRRPTGRAAPAPRAAGPPDAVAPAARAGSPRAIAAYLNGLRPVTEGAVAARTVWVRELNALRDGASLSSRGGSAVQAAVGQARQFADARSRLAASAVPPDCREVHRSLDAWLQAMAGSCRAVAGAPAPLSPQAVGEALDRMKAAARAAERFNAARAAALAGLDGEGARRRRAPFRLDRRTKVVAVAGLLGMLLLLGLVWALVPSGEPAADVARGADRRVYTRPEILAKLREEIGGRGVVFVEPDVRLVAPDGVVVAGKIPASELPVPAFVLGDTRLVDVAVELKVAVEAGKPRITPVTITAAGVTLPAWPFEALTLRAAEGNRELARRMPPNETLRRVRVEADQVVAELDPIRP